MTSVSSIGSIPFFGGGASQSSGSVGKTLGGSGLMAGDHTGNYARSIQLGGPLRGRNLDGLQGDPEIYFVSVDTVLANAVLTARGGVQEIIILGEVERCDIFEVALHSFIGSTPSGIAAMQGGFYTSPPQADGQPYEGSAILPWETTYGPWGGGYTMITKVPVRQMFVPDVIFWIPKVMPPADFSFEVQFRAACYWEQQSTITEAR